MFLWRMQVGKLLAGMVVGEEVYFGIQKDF
jgi:hypothetical protein